ncbi:terminal protein [Nocardia sp. NPDC051030]|uniref:terminal protein n=1 Tax=Nocardia sp. NPDC051030 TaxID=3155162 RepID=UPI003413DA7B
MSKRRHRGYTTELEEKDPGRRGALFRGLTGRKSADVSGTAGETPNLKAMLLAAYGPGKRGGEIDTRAAAKGLGVSQRTVERYVKGEIRNPKPGTLTKLETASRRAATTKAGRARAIEAMRNSPEGKKLLKYGGSITVTGRQGAEGGDGWYIRHCARTMPTDLSTIPPDQIDGLWSAYVDGGDKGASDYLHGLADEHYLNSWTYETISDISIDPPD